MPVVPLLDVLVPQMVDQLTPAAHAVLRAAAAGGTAGGGARAGVGVLLARQGRSWRRVVPVWGDGRDPLGAWWGRASPWDRPFGSSPGRYKNTGHRAEAGATDPRADRGQVAVHLETPVFDVPLTMQRRRQLEVPQNISITNSGGSEEVFFRRILRLFSDSVHLDTESRLSADFLASPRWPTVLGRRGLGCDGDARSQTPRCVTCYS